jgi:hypothetical protein
MGKKSKKMKKSQRFLVDDTSPNQNNSMATPVKVDVVITNDDGTTSSFSSAPGTPPVSPAETEVDVQMSDGTTKVFVPKV